MRKILVILSLLSCIQISAQEKVAEMLIAKGYDKNTRAIIVANEDYQSYSGSPVYVENEELAILEAEKFQQMLIKKVGVLPQNIRLYPDVQTTTIKLAITSLLRDMPADAKIIFYYRGKLFADKRNSDIWIIPVDVIPFDISDEETLFLLGMKDLCSRLNKMNKGGVAIFLDAIPNTSAGSANILENGYQAGEVPVAGLWNMELFTLKVPPPAPKPEEKVTAGKPLLTITEPSADSVATREITVTIRGSLKSDCPLEVVAVGGQEANITEDGGFMAKVVLTEGENKIFVEARNCAGWTRKALTFIFISPEAENQDITGPGNLNEQGKNYAVVIGISKYSDPVMPDLYYPIFDARKVAGVLTSYYTFNRNDVILLENPTKTKIIKTLDSLENVITGKDNLLIFYAGHGNWDEKKSIGYWLPSDAAARALDNWLMNSIITAFVSESKALHTLVIADACFGGSIFRTRALPPEEVKTISELYSKPSKKAMTSGDLMEVPDESVFVKSFVDQLSANKEDYLPTEKLFFSIKPNVVKEADLIPQFGTIKNSGDQGGDFIFFRKQ
ncbi:MAG: caspase family protein [Bacteroidales bacterium]|jgi:hypothetical protein|nr:caspase family protein [Bacteroidales bacterium]